MKLIETYIYYDRPLLFLGEHEGAQFLNVLADSANGAEIWACVKVSPEEAEAFRNGLVDARLLYSEPADRDALIITVDDDGAHIIETEASSMSLAYKPDWGCYLRKESQRHTCPVCEYDQMTHPPKDYMICPRCGTEFGNDDTLYTYEELRAAWEAKGRPWFSRKVESGSI